MSQDKEIKEILEKKLVGNDINIADMIMNYLRRKCYMCNEKKVNTHTCYGHGYGRFEICNDCADTYNFNECFKCEVYTNSGFMVGKLNVCNGCSALDCWCE